MASFRYQSGLGNQAAYLVSGRPFASGSLSCAGGAQVVTFPAVTKFVTLINHDTGNALKCGFSQNGLAGSNHFSIGAEVVAEPHAAAVTIDVKVTEMWFDDSENFDVIAGLTNINVNQINTSGSINWSGSSGVG
tara:strand:- start:3732 stop:4133 length:402 start_codon:yes stop_codon:yes gene_type:complete